MRQARRVLIAVCFLAAVAAACGSDELVRNGRFAASPGKLPESWTAWQPEWQASACSVQAVADGLRMEAQERPYAVGGVRQSIAKIEPGKPYAVEIRASADKIVAPLQSVLVRLVWTRGGNPLHPAGIYIHGPAIDGSRLLFSEIITAPADADGTELSLELKWPQGGSVTWHSASLCQAAAAPPPRQAKVGTVYLRPRNSTPERNLDLCCQQIDAAGKLGLDIVCLSEAVTVIGTPQRASDVAETIPGPASERLGAAAKRNHLWVVAGLYERDGQQLFNSAVLLDRDGRLAGKYRKIHLPREEWIKGMTPGSEYPVFRTDFGTIGIQICYDWFFPEVAEILALKGAEIVFAPTWGDTMPDSEGRAQGESVFRVRARDNGIYLVPSVYDGSSMVIDPLGRVLASNRGHEGIFWCQVDLGRREPLPWVGHWRSIGPRDRMPGTYAPLVMPAGAGK